METFLYVRQVVGIAFSVIFGGLWLYGMIKKLKNDTHE